MVPDETTIDPKGGFEVTAVPELSLMPVGNDYSKHHRYEWYGRQDRVLHSDVLSVLLFDDDDSDEEDMDEDDSFDDMDDDFDDDFDDDEVFEDEDEDEDYEDEDEDYDYGEGDYDEFDE